MKSKNLAGEKFLYFLMLIVLVYPPVINSINIVSILFRAILAGQALFMCFVFVLMKRIPSQLTIVLCVFSLWQLATTALNNGYVIKAVFSLVCTVAFALWVEYSITKEYFYKITFNVFEGLIYINAITILILPLNVPGYEFRYLLGNHNSHIQYYLPALVIAAICNHKGVYILRAKLLGCVIGMCLFSTMSATSLIGMFVFVVILLIRKQKNSRIVNSFTATVTYVVAYVAIVFFRVQDIFAYIIINILGKNLTLTSRLFLWDRTIELIKDAPIIGYGLEYESVRFTKYLSNVMRAHNQILEYVYVGGVIALALYVIYNYMVAKKLYEYRKYFIAKILVGAMLASSIMTISEVHDSVLIYILFYLAYNIKEVIEVSLSDKKTLYRSIGRNSIL